MTLYNIVQHCMTSYNRYHLYDSDVAFCRVSKIGQAPRFPIATYHVSWAECPGKGESLAERVAEYRYLYSQEPAKDWWGWRTLLQNTSAST